MAAKAGTGGEGQATKPKRTRAAKPDRTGSEGKGDGLPPEDPRRPACRIRASVLRAALKDVDGAVAAKSTVPILSHVLLTASDGAIALTGTNLDMWAERTCATDDRDGPGSGEWVKSIRGFTVALPARPLADILAEFDGDAMVTIEFHPKDGGAGKVGIAAGRARFRLHCLPPEDFPRPNGFAVVGSFELRCADLAAAFARVAFAISSEETRYYLNGVYLHPQQAEGEPMDFRFAATDGHRLARLRIDLPEGAASFPPTIVATATVTLLDKLLHAAAKAEPGTGERPSAQVVVEHNGCGLMTYAMPAADGGEIVVTAKAIDGSFPDYQRVIPQRTPHSAVIARATLAEAVKRVGAVATDKTRAVKALFSEDRIELVVTTPELGEAREEVPCLYAGPEVSIGFNGQYWRDALTALASDDVAMAFDAEGVDVLSAPVLLRAAGDAMDRDALVQVLMPMRVG